MRIGIVTPWFERGIAYASLNMWQALASHHDVFVLAKPGPKPVGAEWDVPNLTWGSADQFGFPLAWGTLNQLDIIIFNERLDSRRLHLLKNYFKLVCLHEWEAVDPAQVPSMNETWDAIIAPTECAYWRFVEIGLNNVHLVPWGVDLELFHPPDKLPRTGPLHFFQPATFGGVGGRKNVTATRRAWAKAKTGDATLSFAVQRQGEDVIGNVSTLCGTRDRSEIVKMYQDADVVLLPSMWEGIGLCFMEAMACECALVTVDAPPMRGYVAGEENGLLCAAHMHPPSQKVYVPRARIDIGEYVEAIEEMCAQPIETRLCGGNSRLAAEESWDWSINGRRLLGVIEEIAS